MYQNPSYPCNDVFIYRSINIVNIQQNCALHPFCLSLFRDGLAKPPTWQMCTCTVCKNVINSSKSRALCSRGRDFKGLQLTLRSNPYINMLILYTVLYTFYI